MWLTFFQILPLVFDLFGIGLHGFSIYNASNLMTRGTSFKCYYSYEFFFFLIIFCDFIILNYLKKIVVTFTFFSIRLSLSHYLNHGFCKLFLDKDFFKKKKFVLCLIFFLFFILLHTSRFCLYKK
jgi:hypothetical protein